MQLHTCSYSLYMTVLCWWLWIETLVYKQHTCKTDKNLGQLASTITQVVPLLLLPSNSPWAQQALITILRSKHPSAPVTVGSSTLQQMAAAVLNPAATTSKPLKLLLTAAQLLQQQQEAGRNWSDWQEQELVKAVAAAEGVDPRVVAAELGQRMVNVLWELLPVNWKVNNGLSDAAAAATAAGDGRTVAAVAEAAAVEVWQLVVKDLLVSSSDKAVIEILGSFPVHRSWEAELAALRVAAALQLPESKMLQLVNGALERHKVVGGVAFLQLVLRDKDIPVTPSIVAAMLQQALEMLLPELVGSESESAFDFNFDLRFESGTSSSGSKGDNQDGQAGEGSPVGAAGVAAAIKSAVAVAKAAAVKDSSAAAFDFLMHVSNAVYMGGGGRGGGSSLGAEVEEQLLEATAAAAVAALSHPHSSSSAVTAAGTDDSSSMLAAGTGSSHQPPAAAAVGAPGAAYAALLSSIPWLVRALLEHGCYSSCKDVARAAACNSRQGLLLPRSSSRKQWRHATAGTHMNSTSSNRRNEKGSCCSAEVLGQMLQQVLEWEGCTAAASGEVKAVQQVVEAVAEGLLQGCIVEDCLVLLGHMAPVLGAKVGKRVVGAAGGRLHSVRRQVDLILEGLE